LGLIEIHEHLPQRRNLLPSSVTAPVSISARENPDFVLSTSQEHAREQLAKALQASAFQVFLLHGVTGSGKTEVYLQAAQETLHCGRSVLILVPEIGLTHQLIEHTQQRFGKQVAVLHSALVNSQRLAEWWRVAHGEATVVIGVRSAVFAPLPRLGLIVVDEEHDTSYKQEEGVRYNARDLAIVRGKIAACPVILGSATPSLESYAHSHARRYTLLTLPERVESRPLPSVEIIDLRQEARAGNTDKIFSTALRTALLANYQAGKQSLLFLNRRGYANYLQCHLCGEVLSCSHCSVTLRLHLKDNALRCHYCGFSRPAPERCPHCHGDALAGHGFGTEQVEGALRSFLPNVRVGRLDRDSVSRREALGRVLSAWRAHELDVLIGTQMAAKGHDVPGVTLVGVLLADVSLNLPDFRAAERTFQLLTQVAGRAGRGQEPGQVIVQTYMPEHYSIRFAARHDFDRFAAYELRYRKRLGYPPFAKMVSIRIEGKGGEKVQAYAESVAHYLLANVRGEGEPPVVLGPAPAPIERVKDRERWQVLVKGKDRRTLLTLVRKAQEALFAHRQERGVRVIIDVDPYSML
jgi:primosomal protein N' (replication factor Y)